MKGHLHIAPVLHLPDPDIDADDILLKVEATHRVMAPYQPTVRKAHSCDDFAIAGLRDSVFGWTVDLSFEATLRPLIFQFNWSVRIEGRDRACQHRLTITPLPAVGIRDPLWSTDASFWPDEAGKVANSAYRTPISVFTQSQLIDELQRDLRLTARPHFTSILETVSIPPIERGDMSAIVSERYAIATSAAA